MPKRQDEKTEYLKEHIAYEVLMLRHTHARLCEYQDRLARSPNNAERLDWNAFLEAFAVHARILFEFLSCEQQSRNWKASDYAGTYSPPSKAQKSKVSGTLDKIDQQIFHLAKCRTTKSSDKVNTTRVQRLFELIDRGLRDFNAALDEAYKPHWISPQSPVTGGILKLGTSTLQATNVFQTVTSSESVRGNAVEAIVAPESDYRFKI